MLLFQIHAFYSYCTPLEADSTVSLAHELLKYKEKNIKSTRENAAKFRDQLQKHRVTIKILQS